MGITDDRAHESVAVVEDGVVGSSTRACVSKLVNELFLESAIVRANRFTRLDDRAGGRSPGVESRVPHPRCAVWTVLGTWALQLESHSPLPGAFDFNEAVATRRSSSDRLCRP